MNIPVHEVIDEMFFSVQDPVGLKIPENPDYSVGNLEDSMEEETFSASSSEMYTCDSLRIDNEESIADEQRLDNLQAEDIAVLLRRV